MQAQNSIESNVQIGYLRGDGTGRYIFTGRRIYNFDGEQTALLDRILPLIASGDYHLIGEICDEYVAIPF